MYDSDEQSGLGTGAVIVMDNRTDIVKAIARVARVSLISVVAVALRLPCHPLPLLILATGPLPAPRRHRAPLHLPCRPAVPITPLYHRVSDYVPPQFYKHESCGERTHCREGTSMVSDTICGMGRLELVFLSSQSLRHSL